MEKELKDEKKSWNDSYDAALKSYQYKLEHWSR